MTPGAEIHEIRISEANIPHPVYGQKDNMSLTSSEMSFHLN